MTDVLQQRRRLNNKGWINGTVLTREISRAWTLEAAGFLTFSLTDHDIAVFTLAAIIKALHLDVVRGLGLQVSNQMPVFYT